MMKKRMIRLFAAMLLCAMLFPLASCNSSFGTFMTVTSSLKDKGYQLTRVIPVGLIPADLMEQPQTESNADIKVENLQWVIIAESEQQKQHELLVFVFKDDASANIFWEQIPAMISEAFAPAEHTCMYRTDYSTGKTYCPYCVEQPAFEIEESENTIRIIENSEEDMDGADSRSIIKDGSVIYIET